MANPFNKFWSGLDFWDKEENKRQRQQFAQQEQPKPQPQPQDNQIKVVAQPQQQPALTVQNQPQPQPTIQVKNIDPNRQDIKLPDGTSMNEVAKTPRGRVEAGLNAGKSWEDIAKENGLTLESVREYSQKTRPNYGYKKPEYKKGVSGVFEKLGDKLEANSEQDKWNRREQGKDENYDGEKFWQRGRDFAVGAAREFARVPETVYSSIIKGGDETSANEIDRALAEKDPQKRREIIGKILDPDKNSAIQFRRNTHLDPNLSDEELIAIRDRLRGNAESAPEYDEGLKRFFYGSEPVQTYQQRMRGMREEFKTGESAAQQYLEGKGEGGRETADTIARNAGWIAPLLAVLGVGADIAPDLIDLAKGAGKKGIKELGEESTDEIASAVLKSATKEGEKSLDDIFEQAVEELPQVRVQVSEDLKSAPNVDVSDIRKKNLEEMEIGTDSTPDAELDATRVKYYEDRIKSGEPIDPLVVTIDNGKVFVQDGAHRRAALKNLGINEAPIVRLERGADGDIQVINGQTINTKTGEILEDTPANKDIQKAQEQVEDAKQPIAKQQEQASQQATSGNIAEGADDYMKQIQARREEWNKADEPTRAEMVARAQGEVGEDLSLEVNPWSRQAVYEDLLSTGMTPEEIATLTQRYGMNAQEWRAVLNASGDLSGARSIPAVLDSQIRKVTGREPKAAARQAEQPAEQAARGADEATQQAVEVSVYENNINQIKEAANAALTRIDDFLKKNDSSYEQLARKIQQADRSNIRPELSDAELRAYTLIREELDKTLAKAIQAGRASADTKMREWYLPQAQAGRVAIPETMEDLYRTGFGYDVARKNAIDLDELDYGFDPLIDYVVKGKAAESVTKQRIYEDIVTTNPNITREAAEAATETRAKMIDDINRLADDPKADVNAIDSAGALKKEAEELGVQRTPDNSRIDRFSINNEDRLKSIGQYNKGFYQYRSAEALAQNVTDTVELPQFFREIGLEHLPDKRIEDIVARTEYLLENSGRYMQDATEQQLQNYAQNVVANAIRSASKANIEEVLRITDFTDANTLKFMNSEFNHLAIGFNKAMSTTNQLIAVARRLMNNSMRNLNVNSFLNEMTDVVNAVSRFGVEALPNLSPRGMYEVVDRYGMGRTLNAMDNPDAAVEAFNIFKSGDKKAIDQLFKMADTIDRKTALYTLAENYKAAVYLRSAEDFYTATTNLRGVDLTNKVLEDFYRDMLPLDHFSQVFSSDKQVVKLLTQYLDWNILNTRQQFRNLVGQQAGGKYAGMSRGGRISRNLAVNLAPRIGLGMVRGVPIVTTLGILDPAGVLTPDYSGIQDKNVADNILQYAGVSPILGLATQAYFNYRQDEEAEKMYEGEVPEDLRGDWAERSIKNIGTMFTPFGGQIKRTGGMLDVMDKGYSENKNGRVQYLAPENPLDILRGLVMGKGQTMEGREYSGTPDIFSMFNGDASPLELFTSNPSVESVTGQGDYQRPLSDRDYTLGKDENGEAIQANYSDMVKALIGENKHGEAENLLQGGRDFNSIIDTFRDENPDAYKLYEETFSGNFVKPEFWRQIIGGNADGSADLATWKMMGERKKQLAKDLGAPYDPIYDLPDDNARAILQYKAAATGDDIALQNILYKSQWYKDYVANRDEFYDKMPENAQDETGNTERVKQWNAYEKQLIGLKSMEDPSYATQFPYTSAYKAAQREYEEKTGNDFYGSDESKAWFNLYGEGYKSEKQAVDAAELELINAMRGIEGFPPMTMEQYAQATNIVNTSGGGGGGGGSRGSFQYIPEFFNSFKAQKFEDVKTPATKFKPKTRVARRKNPQVRLGAKSSGRGA